jgi:anti-sigma factor RsiW
VNKETRVPDWMLERYLLDELPRKERRQMEQELERDPALRAALERLRQDDRRVLAAYPPDQVIQQILNRAALARPEAKAARPWRLAWIAAPALALALFMLVILPPLLQRRLAAPGGAPTGDYTAAKGDGAQVPRSPALRLYRRGSEGDRVLADGATVRAGDLIQVAYSAAGRAHGVILSIDGAGAVTLHFPETEESATALAGGPLILLPSSFELDRAPRFERFIFITAAGPLPTAAIMEKAWQLAAAGDRAMTAPLDLPAGFGQVSLLLRK